MTKRLISGLWDTSGMVTGARFEIYSDSGGLATKELDDFVRRWATYSRVLFGPYGSLELNGIYITS